MRTTSTRMFAIGAIAALTAGIGSAIAAESNEDTTATDGITVAAADEELVDRLLVLEPDVPAPLPTTAELAADGVDGLLTGSFTSARSSFDAIEEELRALFVDADGASSAVGDAVAAVAHGLLLERQALLVLEETDSSDVTRPLDLSDARDEDGVAIDADGLYGRQVVALDILLDARAQQRAGYEVLSDLPAGVDETATFAARHLELLDYRDSTEVALRAVASTESPQLLVEVDRYDAPIGVAQAVGVTYVCVDREAYVALADAPEVERIAGSVAMPDEECRTAARLAGLPLSEQVAVDPMLDGVETAVGAG